MRDSRKISYVVIIGAATLAFLVGCSEDSNRTTPSTGNGETQQSLSHTMAIAQRHVLSHSVALPGMRGQPGVFKPFVHTPGKPAPAGNAIAISDYNDGVVDIFDSSGTMTQQLTGFFNPEGLASDIKGDLYIADTSNSQIQVYAKGLHGSPTMIADPGQFPTDVDSFSNGKYLAVTNISTTSGGAGSINIYKGTTLTKTIKSPSILSARFCAFDATGNLYVTALDGSALPSIGEVVRATSGGSAYIELQTQQGLAFPGGIQVTKDGQIAVDDQGYGAGSTIYTYDAPTSGTLGPPGTTTLSGSGDVVSFAFTKNMVNLIGADADLDEANEYAYPAGGLPSHAFVLGSGTLPIGAAIIPTEYPKVY